MEGVAASLDQHRVAAVNLDSVCVGTVRYAPVKSAWFLGMLTGAIVGGAITFSWSAFAAFLLATAAVLLFGHSLAESSSTIATSVLSGLNTFSCTSGCRSDSRARSVFSVNTSCAITRSDYPVATTT
jgi:hypothetical protein